MKNVEITVTIQVAQSTSWSDSDTLAKSIVSVKGEYEPGELLGAMDTRIGEAKALASGRLVEKIRRLDAEQTAKAARDDEQNSVESYS